MAKQDKNAAGSDYVKLSTLTPNPTNPRVLKSHKFYALLRSIFEFYKGLSVRPVVKDANGIIIGGNMRLRCFMYIVEHGVQTAIDTIVKETRTEDDGEEWVATLADIGARIWEPIVALKAVPPAWVADVSDFSDEEIERFMVVDNVGFGEWDWSEVANRSTEKWGTWGFEMPKWMLGGDEVDEGDIDQFFEETAGKSDGDKSGKTKMVDKFLVPPFSILDSKQGYWTKRKNYWLNLGIKSELGREGDLSITALNLGNYDEKEKLESKLGRKLSQKEFREIATTSIMHTTSIFDPVLCELTYAWFCPKGGKVLDPFAGGSVRGIVAAKMFLQYLGNDLREEQILANRKNAVEVLSDAVIYPIWTIGDSKNIKKLANGFSADLIFSCPPYADLEVYSDKLEDISNKPYAEFIALYRDIIRESCDLLKENRFAVWVIGEVRGPNGEYYNFVGDTIKAFMDCGLYYYNEMILVNVVGSLPVRAGRQFNTSRKIGKHHQNVLVFYKGDMKKIKENFPEIDMSWQEYVYIEENNNVGDDN